MSIKDNLGVETDELFVLKTKWIKETTKKTIEIHDFLKKIEDDKKGIQSPKFKLAGVEFAIDVYPNNIVNGSPDYIGVFLFNYSGEDQTISMTVKEASGLENLDLEMDIVETGRGWGFHQFLTHEKYRAWAKDNGDVFKLRAEVTVHTKVDTAEDGWTR